jgi:hypothetical protein
LDPLESIKKLFLKRLDPLIDKDLLIKPWIKNLSQKENSLENESISFNKNNPEFLLLVKFLFVNFKTRNRQEILVEKIWLILTLLCEFQVKLSNISLFFKIVERYHNPVDSASNYLRKFTSSKNVQFLKRAKSIMKMGVDIKEFFLIIFLFIYENFKDKSKPHKSLIEDSFMLFIERIRVSM